MFEVYNHCTTNGCNGTTTKEATTLIRASARICGYRAVEYVQHGGPRCTYGFFAPTSVAMPSTVSTMSIMMALFMS